MFIIRHQAKGKNKNLVEGSAMLPPFSVCLRPTFYFEYVRHFSAVTPVRRNRDFIGSDSLQPVFFLAPIGVPTSLPLPQSASADIDTEYSPSSCCSFLWSRSTGRADRMNPQRRLNTFIVIPHPQYTAFTSYYRLIADTNPMIPTE